MNASIAGVIFRKEMLDIFRDKRAVIATFVTPILLYPGLFLFSTQAVIMQQDRIDAEESRIAIVEPAPSRLTEWLEAEELLTVETASDAAAELAAGRLDAVVVAEAPVEAQIEQGGSATVRIEFDGTENASREAMERIEDVLRDRNDELLAARLEGAGIEEGFIRPLAFERENTAPPSKTTGFLLGAILPMIMVVMLGVGAFYPAVDLTAGEKERGTFETLLSTPVRKTEIVVGKFMAVVLIALLTGALNLLSIVLCMGLFMRSLNAGPVNLEFSLSPGAVALMFVFLVPLALFISSAMMSIAVTARSFREAQNFVTPFFMVIMFPAVFAAVPGTELTASMQFVPITNVALLFKEILKGQVDPQAAFAVFLSTATYAAIALGIAAYIFQREDILLAEDKGLPLTLRRGAFRPRSVPTAGQSLALVCVVLLLLFYVGSWAQERHAAGGLILTQWGLILAPVVAILWYTRVNLRESLALRIPGPWQAAGAILIALSWPVVAIQFGLMHNAWLPMPEHMGAAFEAVFEDIAGAGGLPMLLFAAAISPAICEEALFRGALASGLRRAAPLWIVIAVTALLFGVFHLSIYRILPTAFTGLILGYAVLRGGSLWIGVAIHFVNNASGLLLTRPAVQEALRPVFDVTAAEAAWLPWSAVIAALMVSAAGVACIEQGARIEARRSAVLG